MMDIYGIYAPVHLLVFELGFHNLDKNILLYHYGHVLTSY